MSTDMITITFPEVKIEIPIKGLTFDILENMIFDIIQKIAQRVFTKVLSDIDCYLRKNRRRGQLENTGRRKKIFLTHLMMSPPAVPVILRNPASPVIFWMRPYPPSKTSVLA